MPEEMAQTPLPFDMALAVNGSEQATVGRNDPLLFRASLANHAVMSADSHNRSLPHVRVTLDLLLKEGRIDADQHRRFMEETTEQNIEPVVLGSDATPWWYLIRFQVAAPASKEVNWNFRVVGPTKSVVALNASSSSFADFQVDEESLASASAGHYEVQALVTATEGSTVRSNTVDVQVIDAPTTHHLQDGMTAAFLRGEILFRSGDFDHAWSVVEAALNEQSQGIRELMLAGDIQMARGRPPEALSFFEWALEEFGRQYGDTGEPPVLLHERILRARRALSG